ncbi:MAG: flagellin [Chitinispirillales bacterium]|nr:flagellin [Chitinispirillales bacterium]
MPRINHNIQSMYTSMALRRTDRALTGTLERLATGLSINRASDNAAGLSVSEQLRKQISGTEMGNRNIQDGLSVLNIAEGALTEIGNMLQRIRELAVQSSTATYSNTERDYMQIEVQFLSDEIDRIAACTQFNKMSLLNGDTGTSFNPNNWGDSTNGAFIHVSAGYSASDDVLNIKLGVTNCKALGIKDILGNQILLVNSATGAQAAIADVDDAITELSSIRARIGAYSNRLDSALTNQQNMIANMISAESVIRDTNYASEMSDFVRLNVLQQSSTAMLSQANSLPNNILSLLNQ